MTNIFALAGFAFYVYMAGDFAGWMRGCDHKPGRTARLTLWPLVGLGWPLMFIWFTVHPSSLERAVKWATGDKP